MWFEHGSAQAIPMDTVTADGIADAADPIQTLRSVVHVEESVVMDHRRVEDVITLPIRAEIGKKNGVGGVALELERHSLAIQE